VAFSPSYYKKSFSKKKDHLFYYWCGQVVAANNLLSLAATIKDEWGKIYPFLFFYWANVCLKRYDRNPHGSFNRPAKH
jgi:hypothetical protein